MDLFRMVAGRQPKSSHLAARAPSSQGRAVSMRMVFDEDAFMSVLYLERRRAERAKKRYVLIILNVKYAIESKRCTSTQITRTLCEILRETDIIGWYVQDSLIGIIGTEIGQASAGEVRKTLSEKFHRTLQPTLGSQGAFPLVVSFHFFPEECEEGSSIDCENLALYPDLRPKGIAQKIALGVKRSMDIVGSAMALIILSPLFALIALAVKMTSTGPVLFRQERLGHYGEKFTLLKFRSMRTDCDSRIHEEYVSQFIAGRSLGDVGNANSPVFKIRQDPRVTPIGQFLRRTSLDELPQFWNVLVGKMSLVGPRPPVQYEFKVYDVWHRRRVFEVKPGITGLWQIKGRSSISFDEMVRLDLQYARKWTIWLDLKILLQTPAVVISGNGAL
jgi:lipopolysaccharide/colanic/teichoic acid biosynthesis glycosyltransferase